ncbi:hypothetical protein CDD82_2746 [Ophiocordyceps australis]|uniref:Translation initiation factor 3 N-terminal domain-containing protein n=1 Tax=Ophiocordyceps australis TaxID=1399860 RepID=A0A2C5XQL3_9HYPO|nr:hypothetical protein CDD82_2746 [Ophiocordyceps australis]
MKCPRLGYLSHLFPPRRGHDGMRLLLLASLATQRRYSSIRGSSTPKAPIRRQLQDLEIQERTIMVIDGDGPPDGPFRTAEVLSRLANHENLIMLQRAKNDRPAVCKIVTQAALQEQREADAAKQRQAAIKAGLDKKLKELELTWGIADHDLGIKMRQLKGFLEKGHRVEVLLGKRRKGGSKARVGDEARETAVQRVRRAVEEVGGMETRTESRSQGTVRLFVEGKKEKAL